MDDRTRNALMMQWTGVGASDIGRVRSANQDAFLINNQLGLWIVADGMGSHPHSDQASLKAVHSIETFLHQYFSGERFSSGLDWPTLLKQSIHHAHESIQEEVASHPELTGIGTTVVLAFMPDPSKDSLFIAHSGDSRAYLLKGRTLTLLTRDHTLLEERIRLGLLPQNTPASHESGHILTQAVGIDFPITPDCSTIPLQPHDTVLLCTDGLNKMLEDETLSQLFLGSNSSSDPEDLCHRLIQGANHRGGHDNVTVVVIQKT